MRFVDSRLLPLLEQKTKWKPAFIRNLSRAAGIFVSVVVAVLILYAFFSMLLPQLYESVVGIVDNAETYYTSIDRWVTNILEDNPEIQSYVDSALGKIYDFINNWITTTFLQDVQKLLTTLTSSVVAFVKGFMNFLIGLRRVDLYPVVEGDVSGAEQEDHRRAALAEGRGSRVLSRPQYLPGVQRLRHRQDRRLGHHRRSLLYRHSDPQDAVSGPDRHGHRRDDVTRSSGRSSSCPCAFLFCC